MKLGLGLGLNSSRPRFGGGGQQIDTYLVTTVGDDGYVAYEDGTPLINQLDDAGDSSLQINVYNVDFSIIYDSAGHVTFPSISIPDPAAVLASAILRLTSNATLWGSWPSNVYIRTQRDSAPYAAPSVSNHPSLWTSTSQVTVPISGIAPAVHNIDVTTITSLAMAVAGFTFPGRINYGIRGISGAFPSVGSLDQGVVFYDARWGTNAQKPQLTLTWNLP